MRRAWLVTLLFLAGCPKPAQPSASGTGPPAVVQEACARCHAFPPADVLPKARWREIVPTMLSLPGPEGVEPLTADELQAALAYYEATAPEALPRRAPSSTPSGRERFRVESFTPRGLEKRSIPAVANVRFGRLFHKEQLDVLLTELRSQSLMLLAPWAPPKYREIRPLQRGLAYPAHVAPADVDGDGKVDYVVGSLGGLVPSNEKTGQVFVLHQEDGKEFTSRKVAEGLGRVADARAADLDGDGDQDLVVAAFGWRGPGALLVLEATAQGWKRRELDERDGWVAVEVVDLNGDGALDLVTLLAQEHEQVIAWLGQGDGTFTPRILHRAPHPAWGYAGLEAVDLDGDGDLDVLLANGDSLDDDLLKPYHGVAWLENRGKEGFAYKRLAALYGCQKATAGDLDGDGDLDIVAVSFLPQLEPAAWKGIDSVVWLRRDAEGWTRMALETGLCVHPTVALGDWNRDGRLDIAVGNYVWVGEGGAARSQTDYLKLFTAK